MFSYDWAAGMVAPFVASPDVAIRDVASELRAFNSNFLAFNLF